MNSIKSYLFVALLVCLIELAQCQDESEVEYLNLKGIDLNQDAEITLDEFRIFIN